MRMAQQQADLFYRPIEFYTTAGILYFIAVMGVTKLFSFIEKKMNRIGFTNGSQKVANVGEYI